MSISGYSSGDFLFTEDAYYMFPASSEQERNILHIRELDFNSGKLQDVTLIENGQLYVSSDQTNSGTCLFLVQIADDKQNSQRLYTLTADKNLGTIYDSAQIGLTAPEFSALSAGEDTIFLLRQTVQAEQLITEIVEMDLNGAIRRTIALPGLEDYSEDDYFADKLYVVDEYIFIKWYDCGERLPYFSAFKIVDGKAKKLETPQNAPCYLLTKELVKDRYLLFSAFPDEMDYSAKIYTSHLYAFDTLDDQFIGISLPLAQKVVFNDMVCNEYGDIVMNIVEETGTRSTTRNRTIRIDFDDLECLL